MMRGRLAAMAATTVAAMALSAAGGASADCGATAQCSGRGGPPPDSGVKVAAYRPDRSAVNCLGSECPKPKPDYSGQFEITEIYTTTESGLRGYPVDSTYSETHGTGKDGRFKAALQPGRWQIEHVPREQPEGSPFCAFVGECPEGVYEPSCPSARFTVRPHRFTRVRIYCEGGGNA